ncbi:MAG: class I SAM-dependent methyltransferase [Candidatus Heimdallarchaeaceae archaeon]
MKFKEKLQKSLKGKIPKDLLDKLPSGYAVIGDIAVVRHLNPKIDNYRKAIGKQLISIDPQVKIVVEQLDTVSLNRKPVIMHIAGEKRTKTSHKEFNTIFKIDLESITFSPGNKNERNHLVQTVSDNEVICDMFACIGNLSLPIVVNRPSVIVYGIEWNQIAFDFLKQNIEINKVNNRYFPIYGNNRNSTPRNFATRVLMGYFNIDYNQFRCALEAIENQGWIHYHSLAQRDNLEQPIEIVEQAINESGYKIEVKEIRQIKKYSPRLYHLCSDIFVEKY